MAGLSCGALQCGVPYHRFRLWQEVVVVTSGRRGRYPPTGRHVVVRLLPEAGPHPEYRVRSATDQLERVVTEDQIMLAPEQLGATQAVPARVSRGRR